MIYNILLVLYLVCFLIGLALVFRKAQVAAWKAFIPVYNIVLWIKICGKDWRWYIYFLVPAINIFTFLLLVVETAKVFRRYGLIEQTISVILPWAYLLYLGLNKKMVYTNPKDLPPHKVSNAREWADALIFALIAAVVIRNNVVEFYNIPSSSMEKSLLTGDYVMVSKLAYGPRVNMIPLSIPLVHNQLFGHESYLSFLELPYHRYPGIGKINRFDATVFNYPDGDTVCTAFQSNWSYHDIVRQEGREAVYSQPNRFGKVIARPMSKKENFIKRTIGLPGEELRIVDQQVLINGKPIENPYYLQFTYAIDFAANINGFAVLSGMGVSDEDINTAFVEQQQTRVPTIHIPLSNDKYQALKLRSDVVKIEPVVAKEGGNGNELFPHADNYKWTVDNYGPVVIPAKGMKMNLTIDNLPLYRRAIETFEGNTVAVSNGKILINGKETNEYTFKMDYFWLMGDNRHNSADSRFWGFVPENHIVGKASRVVFSRDKEKGKIRWERFLRNASKLEK